MEPENTMRADSKTLKESMNLSPLLGTWINTNQQTTLIAKFIINDAGNGGLTLRVFGTGDSSVTDWGEVPAHPCAKLESRDGMAFHARYEFAEGERWLASNYKLNVAVIQTLTFFNDGSGRPNYFAREFFRRLDDPV